MSDSEHNKTIVPSDSSSNVTSQRKNISQEDVYDRLINMIDMFKELLLNSKITTEGFAKVEATTQDISEKCEKLSTIENNLVDVAENSSASTAKLNEVCNNMPSVVQVHSIEQSLSELTENFKRQTAESNNKLDEIVERLENAPVESLAGDSERFQQFQNSEPQYHSTPNRALFQTNTSVRDTNPKSDEIPSNMFEQSIQHGRGGVKRTPHKHDSHEAPGIQTRNQKAQTQLQETALKENANMQQPGTKEVLKEQNFNTKNNNYHNYTNSNRQNDDFKEALKATRNLCQNAQHLEKFDKSKHSVDYFILSRVSKIAKRNNLKRIQDVTPWLPMCFPDNSDTIEREIDQVNRYDLEDHDLTFFLKVLARKCNRPYGNGINEDHVTRKSHESVIDYVTRMFIEYETIVDCKEDVTETKSQTKIAKDIYNILRYKDTEDVRRTTMLCSTMLGPINNRENLEKLANEIDNALVDGPGSSISISAFNRVSSNGRSFKKSSSEKPERYGEKVYPPPMTSNQSQTVKCKCCRTPFSQQDESHEYCPSCYSHMRQREREFRLGNEQTLQQKPNNFSRNRNNYNNRNFNGRRNNFSIVEACTGESVNQSDSEEDQNELSGEISLMSEMSGPYPLNGSEIEEDADYVFQNKESAIQVLHGLGFPKTRDRVFVEFSLPNTDIKGRALIDCGANTDAISSSFIKKAGISKVEMKENLVRDFQGKTCKSPGKAMTCLQLGRCFYENTFMIFESDYKTDVILGMPFLNRYGLGDVLRERVSEITGPNTVLSGEPKNY